MAQGDARRIPTITADSEGKPDLNSVQEAVRQLAENIYKIEGRVGESTHRDDVRIMGGLTLPARVSGVNSEYTTPSTSSTHEGRIYFDGVSNKFLVSENSGSYKLLNPIYSKILTIDNNAYTNVAGFGDTLATTYTIPKNTIRAGQFLRIHVMGGATGSASNRGVQIFIGTTVVNPRYLIAEATNCNWAFYGLFPITTISSTIPDRGIFFTGGSTARPVQIGSSAGFPANFANDTIVKTVLTGNLVGDCNQNTFMLEVLDPTGL